MERTGPGGDPARIDDGAVRALGDVRLDWRVKAVPAEAWGHTAREYAAGRPELRRLGTPLVTLDAGALRDNVAAMAGWCGRVGLDLAPHGKTTMAPELWRRQLAAGAWAVTVANAPQLRVARAFGVSRVLLAGSLLDPVALGWLAGELGREPAWRFVSFVDSARSVALMDAALRAAGARHPVEVCVELGAPGGRTGCRDVPTALAVAGAVRGAPTLRLVGVAGYEGAVASAADRPGLAAVDGYLGALAELHARLAARRGYETDEVLVTAGGSAFVDRIAAVLAPLAGAGTRVLLRAGAYVVHDDGFYRGISAAARGADGPPLRSAMHGWARVVSRPEPGLALLDAGRRDLPFDQALPMPQRILGRHRPPAPAPPAPPTPDPLDDARVTALNDQHAFLALRPESDLGLGEVVRLGLSHPCTALDKWTLLPVLADADADDPVVVDLIHTFF